MNRFRYLLALAVLIVLPLAAYAQPSVPYPQRPVIIDDLMVGSTDYWTMVYPSTAPAPYPGQPFIASLRLIFTPTAGGPPVTLDIPRAAMIRRTTAAECPGGAAPCIRSNPFTLPVGSFTFRALLITGDGQLGPLSDPALPFTGAFPAPPAPGTRAIP